MKSSDKVRFEIEQALVNTRDLHGLTDHDIHRISTFIAALSISDREMKEDFFKQALEISINNSKKLRQEAKEIAEHILKTTDKETVKKALKEIREKLEEVTDKKKILN